MSKQTRTFRNVGNKKSNIHPINCRFTDRWEDKQLGFRNISENWNLLQGRICSDNRRIGDSDDFEIDIGVLVLTVVERDPIKPVTKD